MADALLLDGLPDPAPRNDAAPATTGASVKAKSSPDILRCIVLPVRRNAPNTSREAAQRIAGRAHTFREQVSSNTGNPRRCELRDVARIVNGGQSPRARSGCKAIVWVAAAHAQSQKEGCDGEPA